MCTTIIVARGATVDGSVIVAHADDNELSDQRVIFIPAQDHAPGARRQILAGPYYYPRLVTDRRGPGYDTKDYPPTPCIGTIPEVAHTYAYFDGSYGIMNEHNLMIGECTDVGKFEPDDPVTVETAERTGEHCRLFYTSELSRIALERCKKARDAVQLMGELVDTWGYYSSAETLLVGDEDEAWVFEVCALPDAEFHSAWVAQRVPDGHFFIAANEFRIREIDQQRDDQMCSRLLFPGARKLGWWDPADGPLDWLKTVSPGEYNHPYYSLRRVWRAYDRVAPDLGLSPWVSDGYSNDYPFSAAPERKLGVEDIAWLYRDHFEGTQFDMTKGVAAGPFGDPHRFLGPYDGNMTGLKGAWERPFSVFYQGFTYINQAKKTGPKPLRGIMWLAPDVSFTSVFAPFPTSIAELPRSYQTGSPSKLDRNAAWWAFDFVGNWSRLNFQRMTRVDILPLQKKLEAKARKRLAKWTKKVEEMPAEEASGYLTRQVQKHTDKLLSAWWDLADTLVAKYSDGYLNLPDQAAVELGYPSDWLAVTEYGKGPTTYDMKP